MAGRMESGGSSRSRRWVGRRGAEQAETGHFSTPPCVFCALFVSHLGGLALVLTQAKGDKVLKDGAVVWAGRCRRAGRCCAARLLGLDALGPLGRGFHHNDALRESARRG